MPKTPVKRSGRSVVKAPAPTTPKVDPREPYLFIATGMKGVGKTYRTIQEIQEYIRTTAHKKGRKALIYDVNWPLEKSYNEYPIVEKERVHQLRNIAIRRVVAMHSDQRPYTLDEKAETMFYLLQTCTNGLLVLEDLNNYVLGAKNKEVISVITTNRHRDLDIIIHLQSLSVVDPRMWQNVTIIRFHHQADDITRYQGRIPNYELMKLAQLIVDRQYHLGNKRYFVYINVPENKIIGASLAQFKAACREFLSLNKRVWTDLMKEEDGRGLLFPTKDAALAEFVRRKMYYIK